MKLRAEQLAKQLTQQFHPVYLVSGDEPLLVQESCDLIRQQARQQGFTERERLQVDKSFDWDSLHIATQSMSLFGDKKLIELHIPTGKPGRQGSQALQELLENIPMDIAVLIVAGKIEAASQKSKWFKAIDQAGCIIQLWPLNRQQLPHWLNQRLQSKGLRLDKAGMDLLVDQTEGNLLAGSQAIEKLALLFDGSETLSVEAVRQCISDSARFNVFDLVDQCLAGDATRITRVLSTLQAEGIEPILILWALAREVRQLAQMAFAIKQGESTERVLAQFRVWDKRKPIVRQALARGGPQRWQRLLQKAAQIDRIIKGQLPGNSWDELLTLSLAMARVPVFSKPKPAKVVG